MINNKYIKKYLFGILHILSTKNDTIIHITDITGSETISRISSGIVATNGKDKKSNYCAMLATQKVSNVCKVLGINALHIKIRARGGNASHLISTGAHTVVTTLVRLGFKIGRIEDTTPTPTNGTRRKGGRRGRRV